MGQVKINGQCLCKAVRFKISAAEVCAHCHCSFCRLSSGAAFVTWVVLPLDKFEILSGEDHVRWYSSSKPSQRGFCELCGSTIFFKSSLCPNEIHVTRANLIEELDLPPRYHCFADKKVSWVSLNDGVEVLTSESKELIHYKQIPPAI